MNPMKKRVLIFSASAGTGHVKAAEALAKTFAQDPRVETVEHKDALIYTNKLFRDFYSKLYVQLIRSAPQLLGWVYKQSDEPWKTDQLRLRLDRLSSMPLVKFIRKFRPDITVCTHFMPVGIISHLISRGLLDAHLSIVVTDLDMHAMWLSRVFHRYFVAIEETKAHLEALGLPPERITVSGIPVDPSFAEPVDRAEIRYQNHLDPDKTTLLVSAGALGVTPAEFVVARLLQLRHDVQGIVICGRNDELRHRLKEMLAPHGDRVQGHRLHRPDARVHEDFRPVHRQTGRADDGGGAGLLAADDHRGPDSRPGGAQQRSPAREGLRPQGQ